MLVALSTLGRNRSDGDTGFESPGDRLPPVSSPSASEPHPASRSASERTGRTHPSQSVVIDARLARRGLGIGRFIRNLTESLIAIGEAPTVLGMERPNAESASSLLRSMGPKALLLSLSPALAGVPRSAVVHFASNSASVIPPKRSVLTVHDLFQKDAKTLVGKAQWQLLRRGLATADVLTPNSSVTADSMIRAGVDSRRIHVIAFGMLPVPLDAGRDRSGVLAFGATMDRKRPELLCSVLEALAADGWDEPITVLARAGLRDDHRARLSAIGATILENASDDELNRLYMTRSALLVTSSEEGFGLPIIEAAEHQLPVVLGRDAVVAKEALGPHCFFAEDNNATTWVRVIREAASVRNPLSSAFLPTWDDVAREYVSVYESLQ